MFMIMMVLMMRKPNNAGLIMINCDRADVERGEDKEQSLDKPVNSC